VHFDTARLDDVDALVRIDDEDSPSPWSRQAFVDEFDRAHSRIDVVRLTPAGPVIAFLCCWIVGDEIQILNLCVSSAHRRKGLAESLLRQLVERSRGQGCRTITLDVRRSNEPAIALYHKLHFRSVGVRPAYYSEGNEDALLMDLIL
jgi:[ribosomal protein S18]-alanine N-acetyltransferase